MAKLGASVTFHTVNGDRHAVVVGHGKEGDNDTELAVFGNSKDDSSTSLERGVNYRWSHEDGQAGGYTA